jgi:dipeptidyl aminopeptidase/acylaminoacyl peptidase
MSVDTRAQDASAEIERLFAQLEPTPVVRVRNRRRNSAIVRAAALVIVIAVAAGLLASTTAHKRADEATYQGRPNRIIVMDAHNAIYELDGAGRVQRELGGAQTFPLKQPFAILPNGEVLYITGNATASEDTITRADGSVVARFGTEPFSEPGHLSISPDGRWLAVVAVQSPSIEIVDIISGHTYVPKVSQSIMSTAGSAGWTTSDHLLILALGPNVEGPGNVRPLVEVDPTTGRVLARHRITGMIDGNVIVLPSAQVVSLGLGPIDSAHLLANSSVVVSEPDGAQRTIATVEDPGRGIISMRADLSGKHLLIADGIRGLRWLELDGRTGWITHAGFPGGAVW